MPIQVEELRKRLKVWTVNLAKDPERAAKDRVERADRVNYYQSIGPDKVRALSEGELLEYIAKLWAMLIWGNKKYVVDKLIGDNGFKKLKDHLADLVWGEQPLDVRWDGFRSSIKGIGPAMMSELLCHVHPGQCLLWNRRTCVGLNHLGVDGLPRYDYQLTGKKYVELCDVGKAIAKEMISEGVAEADLLTVDYFLWDELQGEESLAKMKTQSNVVAIPAQEGKAPPAAEFLHDEVRDRIANIGEFLGFVARTEIKVADGSKVDAVWEATIGNMGRVIYVFEVQTKGSIDSLILNLLKSLNNPAVQGVVAVSDAAQIEKIKKHAAGVPQLNEKLKYWDYEQVLQVYESMESAYASINKLELVPQGFLNV